ncbi:amino acid/polyamine transporter I [Aspergillus stella-maris]|uniref:amino acid/polyamine transporter I n=1 Tax=Aspergillus stella-maris TaxID=1810926 RepID=UPI003CCE13B9
MDDKPYLSDEARLAALGRDQPLKRNFNVTSLIFMGFCTSVTWEVITSSMAQSLLTGGSSSLVWGFLASAIGALMIAFSLSEYASIIPTAGGQYHYVAALSPPRLRRFLSWIAAWVTTWAWIAGALAGFFSSTMQLQSYIILFSEGYVYERWHTCLILIAEVVWCAAISIFGIRWMHRLTFLGVTIHLVGYLTTMIWLLVNAHPKNSAGFVSTDLTNLSGWDSNGVAWSIGLMGSALSLTNWDTAMHLAEEMKDASRDLPKIIWGCVLISGLLTFPWVIALMFCITDVQAILNGPVGTMAPFPQLIYNISGGDKHATIGVSCFNTVLSFTAAGPSIMTATSRIVWSFAREGALPEVIGRVNRYCDVPIKAIILVRDGELV